MVTGRNPYRYGIVTANKGHMKPEEVTIYEALKTKGYRTGHFGKWHLGTLSKTVKESSRTSVPAGTMDYFPTAMAITVPQGRTIEFASKVADLSAELRPLGNEMNDPMAEPSR